jgi:hypothetical protein
LKAPKRVNLQRVEFTMLHQQTTFPFLVHFGGPFVHIGSYPYTTSHAREKNNKKNLLEGIGHQATCPCKRCATKKSRTPGGRWHVPGEQWSNSLKLQSLSTNALLSLAGKPPFVPLEYRSQVLLPLGEGNISSCCATPALAA